MTEGEERWRERKVRRKVGRSEGRKEEREEGHPEAAFTFPCTLGLRYLTAVSSRSWETNRGSAGGWDFKDCKIWLQLYYVLIIFGPRPLLSYTVCMDNKAAAVTVSPSSVASSYLATPMCRITGNDKVKVLTGNKDMYINVYPRLMIAQSCCYRNSGKGITSGSWNDFCLLEWLCIHLVHIFIEITWNKISIKITLHVQSLKSCCAQKRDEDCVISKPICNNFLLMPCDGCITGRRAIYTTFFVILLGI